MDSHTPVETAVSLVIRDDLGRFLIVKRAEDPDDILSDVWGFPATTLTATETLIEGAHRVGMAKLGVEVELGNKIGESTHDRGFVIVKLTDFEARLVDGTPSVPQPDRSITQYDDWAWSTDPTVLFAAARKGSQCSQIFLESIGVDWDANNSESAAHSSP